MFGGDDVSQTFTLGAAVVDSAWPPAAAGKERRRRRGPPVLRTAAAGRWPAPFGGRGPARVLPGAQPPHRMDEVQVFGEQRRVGSAIVRTMDPPSLE
eukprot:860473-Pyramimonas_sp.AAC.1